MLQFNGLVTWKGNKAGYLTYFIIYIPEIRAHT